MAFSFISSYPDTTDTNQYTYAVSFGTAASDRYIIVTASARKAGASTTITGVTIGGVTATEVHQNTHTVTNTDVSGIFIAAVPTGTSGNVVVTYGATMVRSIIGVYRVTELASATAYDTAGYISTSDPTTTLDIPAGGFAVAIALTNSSGTTSWTGLTEDFDGTLETFVTYSGASGTFESAQDELTITSDFSGATTEAVASFASWEISTSTPVTVNAGVITGTTTLPSPTISGSANVSTGVISASLSLPAPSVTGGASVSAGTNNLTASLPTPSVSGAASVSAGVVSGTLSLPAPTVSTAGETTVNADIVSASITLPTPTLSLGATVSADTNALTLAIQAPALSTGNTTSSNVVNGTLSVPNPTITADRNISVSADVVTNTLSIPNFSVLLGDNANIKHYDGGWNQDTLEYFDGNEWQVTNLKYYDGGWNNA